MCGIAGLFNHSSGAPAERSTLELMLSRINHRGPDESGIFLSDSIGLGMTRLAIVDIRHGQQPMTSHDGRYTLVFNGEIYNFSELISLCESRGYRFRTRSDTETILALYTTGIENPEQYLSGMFAYALFDQKEKKLILCRDRMGKKPLFWARTREGVVFGSEIKALAASQLVQIRENFESISNFFTYGYTPGPQSAVQGVEQLPPGHKMTCRQGSLEIERYWKLHSLPKLELSAADWNDRISHTLSEAVKKRLMGDVPVGLFLSGGFDSNSVLGLMRKHNPPEAVRTYTVGFDSPSYDESVLAKSFAESSGTIHKQIKFTHEDFANNFRRVVHYSDNLLANPAMHPQYALSVIASKDVKVVMSGGGGDELFFGYPTYKADALARLARRLPSVFIKAMSGLVQAIPVSHERLSFTYKARKFLEGVEADPLRAHYWWRTIFTDSDKAQLGDPRLMHDSFGPYAKAYEDSEFTDFYEKVAYADLMVWWRDMGLYLSDAIPMGASLEVRVPMMDQAFIELVHQIPIKMRLSLMRNKWMLRRSMASSLPRKVLKTPKRGFHVPLAEWFAGPLRDFVRDHLSADRLRTIGYLDSKFVEQMIDSHIARREDHSYRILNLMTFVEWHHQLIQGRNIDP